jgi:hypothetical protein
MKRIVLKQTFLSAFSKKMAFYRLYLEEEPGRYIVRKESGANNKTLDCREWSSLSYAAAEKLYQRKIKEKTNLERKSKRIYRVLPDNQLPLPDSGPRTLPFFL